MVVPPLDHKLAVLRLLSPYDWMSLAEITETVDITPTEARDYLAPLDMYTYERPLEEYVQTICSALQQDGAVTTDASQRVRLSSPQAGMLAGGGDGHRFPSPP